VTRILHGLRFWYETFLDDEVGPFDFLLFALCGEEKEMSSTICIAFGGDDRGSLTGEDRANVCASTCPSSIDVARGSNELESR
jgi:hypothetical protein